ncbi:MAG: hypothetical protein IPJ77_21395 [Planctomycetes bacterium]|nr:hypothetical protein [Planctomycetota bacterium]
MNRFSIALLFLGVAAITSAPASSQTLGCEPGGAGGPFPVAGTGGGGGTGPTTLPPSPGVFPMTVSTIPAGASVVTEVKLHGLAHTNISNLQIVLTDPLGGMHNLLHRPPGSCDFSGGTYTIVPVCTSGLSWPSSCTAVLPAGTYVQRFGTWISGTVGIDNTRIDTLPAATGTWTLTLYDWADLDVGSLASWELCFGTPVISVPPTVAPNLVSPANGLNVFGPNVALAWISSTCAASYEVEVDAAVFPAATTGYLFASTPGVHTWRVRGVNSGGVGPWSASRTFTDTGPGPMVCSGLELTTIFASDNGGDIGGQVFFDLQVVHPSGIDLAQLETNTSLPIGVPFSMDVYVKPGTYAGSETNLAAWTLLASGVGRATGIDQPSLVDFPDVSLPPGAYGVALVIFGGIQRYTGTATVPPPPVFSNSDLTLTAGAALNVPWLGTPFTPRMWNGRLRYNCSSPPMAFCFGDGMLTDHTTPCPCSNDGTAGNGCANSANANGANLATSGATVTDDVVLLGSGMPATVSCIYLQGTGTDDAVFGDGVRCTGGTLLRLRTKSNVGGASSFPDSVETITLSQRGGVVVGSGVVRNYQTYYRNSAALFCPPETYNVTNGMTITW